MNKGFTLPELLVALFIFSLIVGSAGNLLLSGISAQRHSLANQELINQTSYLAEYMSRAIRRAQKELTEPPICLTELGSGRGFNYDITNRGGLRFVNHGDECQEFFLENGRIKEEIGDVEKFISSAGLSVTALRFGPLEESDRGWDQNDDPPLQPKVTFSISIETIAEKPESRVDIQLETTISQRKYDIRQ